MASRRPEGYERQAPNGYWYRKVGENWVLKHHIVAGEARGYPITKDERVTFKDGNPSNPDPSNLVVKDLKKGRTQRINKLRTRIKVLQEELAELERHQLAQIRA